jgi:predicted  nucleic acid-binding Zn-ribbon protein
MRNMVVALAAAALATGCGEDDVPVDPDTPGARRAAAEALAVVSGRVVEVARDRDNGKWEVIVEQADGRYEVELEPDSFRLLRLDYD